MGTCGALVVVGGQMVPRGGVGELGGAPGGYLLQEDGLGVRAVSGWVSWLSLAVWVSLAGPTDSGLGGLGPG